MDGTVQPEPPPGDCCQPDVRRRMCLMRWAALILALTACCKPMPVVAEPDEFSLEIIGPNEARVDYYNSASRLSAVFPPWLHNGDLSVAIDLIVTRGPETLVVTPPAGWIAVPSNRLTLEDGDQGSIYLIRDLEHLGM